MVISNLVIAQVLLIEEFATMTLMNGVSVDSVRLD